MQDGRTPNTLDQIALLIAVGALACVTTAAATPLFARFARARQIVVAPRADRWHRAPTPLLGGAAIMLGVIIAVSAARPLDVATVVVMTAALAAFGMGLLDDFRRLAPTTKLVGQFLIGALLVLGGVSAQIVDFAPATFVLTVLWVAGIMNAVNLMDNMDGLAAGIAAIAGVSLAITAMPESLPSAVIAVATAGGAFGFLIHNRFPAKVFMGDAGSQLLGFLLAAAALLHTAGGAADVGVTILAPLAVLALPIFDTALVTASRRLAGRPISLGGRDHSSHRLAAMGLTDRSAVLALYVVAIALAAVGIIGEAASNLLLPGFALAVIALILFGTFLSQVNVYGEGRSSASLGHVQRSLYVYGRFGAEVGLDMILLTIAYYAAFQLRFEGDPPAFYVAEFVRSMPLVIGAQLGALVILGVYRTLWRYFGVSDVVTIGRAITFGTGSAVVVLLLAFRFEGHSRVVFVLDWLIAFALIMSTRSLLVWLRHWVASRPRHTERRVLIIGAGDLGALAARLIERFQDARYRAVGFLDEDLSKRFRRIGGVPILGPLQVLEESLRQHRIDLVLVALDDAVPRDELRRRCERSGVEYREFSLPSSLPYERPVM